ncbi:hypothetical protein BX661DRAFT_181158 [Kickxella alabastrina]|uniref:uncharacterized protein n=1 Tax=Kickxella alabastrina TaxID=61397 RepID=UPI00221E437F|nr:uncharacterized protein BX661DRAFT_181158 [Kickxella alabastrina]KAI7830132.1 hypothetical protein BX661DRAFT_181158 [Kickxella alabastrina]
MPTQKLCARFSPYDSTTTQPRVSAARPPNPVFKHTAVTHPLLTGFTISQTFAATNNSLDADLDLPSVQVQISELQRVLQRKTRLISQQKQIIDAKLEEIALLTIKLETAGIKIAARDRWIEAKVQQLAAKDEWLAAKEELLQAYSDRIAAKDAEIGVVSRNFLEKCREGELTRGRVAELEAALGRLDVGRLSMAPSVYEDCAVVQEMAVTGVGKVKAFDADHAVYVASTINAGAAVDVADTADAASADGDVDSGVAVETADTDNPADNRTVAMVNSKVEGGAASLVNNVAANIITGSSVKINPFSSPDVKSPSVPLTSMASQKRISAFFGPRSTPFVVVKPQAKNICPPGFVFGDPARLHSATEPSFSGIKSRTALVIFVVFNKNTAQAAVDMIFNKMMQSQCPDIVVAANVDYSTIPERAGWEFKFTTNLVWENGADQCSGLLVGWNNHACDNLVNSSSKSSGVISLDLGTPESGIMKIKFVNINWVCGLSLKDLPLKPIVKYDHGTPLIDFGSPRFGLCLAAEKSRDKAYISDFKHINIKPIGTDDYNGHDYANSVYLGMRCIIKVPDNLA